MYKPALQALGKLYSQEERWRDLCQMHLAEAHATDEPKRRAAAHARVAQILEERLDDRPGAAEHHARALGHVPGYPPAFRALCRLLAEASRWRELIELYVRAIDLSPQSETATAYLLKIAALYEDQLGEHAQAAHTYRRVLELEPDHLGAIHALQRATERAGRYDEYVAALELEAEKSADQVQVVALLHRAGEVLDEQLNDAEGARQRMRRVLAIDPCYVPALVTLGRLYYREGRWEDLLDMYRRELELTPAGAEAVALRHKMGLLAEERIGDDGQAVEHWRHAIDMDPTHGPSLRALARKLRDEGEWQELTKILELELNGLKAPEGRARTAFRMGEVFEQRLRDVERATSYYQQALQDAPGYRPAVDAITRVRTEQGAWSDLVDELQREASATPDPELATAAEMRLGEIWAEELGDPRRAIQAYEAVLERAPTHLGAMLALEPLYQRSGQWKRLADLHRRELRVVGTTRAKLGVLRELARLQEMHDDLGDPATTLNAILRLDGQDPEALDAIERIALDRGDLGALRAVDEARAQTSVDTSTRAANLTRLGELREAGGDSGAALVAYREALRLDPEALGAVAGLSRVAERTKDPEAIAEAARHEAAIASVGTEASRLLVRSGSMRLERLDDRDGARRDFERALELNPENTEAAQRLTRMLSSTGESAKLADLLSRAASSAKAPDRVAALWLQVSELQWRALKNLPGAISSLHRVLKTSPNHIPTLRRLAELFGHDNQWNESARLWARVIQLAPERDVLRDAHLALAAIWDERLGETSRALVSLQAVLALDDQSRPALARLAALQEREGRLEQAVETSRRLIAASATPRDRAEAFLRLAAVCDKTGDSEGATEALLEALAVEGPGSESALELKTRLETPADWDRYIGALRRSLTKAEGGDSRNVYSELARVYQDVLGRPEEAVEVLREALRESRHGDGLQAELSRRLRGAGRQQEAVQELVSLLRRDVTRADIWRELVRNYEELQQPELVRLALMPLAVLGEATRAEQERLDASPDSEPPRAGSLAPSVLATLGPKGEAQQAAEALLAGSADALAKLHRPDFELYGLSHRDRITSRGGHPLRSLAERVAAVFDLDQFDLFIHRLRNKGLEVELGTPTALLVPQTATEWNQPAQVFLLAKPLVTVAKGIAATQKLTPRELEVALAALCRVVSPDFGRGLTNEDVLLDQQKKLYRALGRRQRKPVEVLAQAYVEAGPPDFHRWVADVNKISSRIAALLADDLLSCVEVLRASDRELSGLRGSELVQKSPEVADLLRFWVSEAAIVLRQRAGLLPSPN